MCANCVVGATAAASGVTGLRAWLVTRGFAWLTPVRKKRVTIGLVVLGVLGASFGAGGA